MRTITEPLILSLAPNATAANNGRKISQRGGFVSRSRSEDDSFYMGECSGSGKANYITSADFIVEEKPVLRCSCPSRQFPCKHCLALLFEISGQKEFALCEIPEDILKKRRQKEARTLRAAEEKKTGAPKTNQAARTKKLKKQLEGLKLTADLVEQLLYAGLGTIGRSSIKTYRDLAKQLGDYYLTGPQLYVNRLILEMEAAQKEAEGSHEREAARILVQLRSLIRKSEAYIQEKLTQGKVEDDDSMLYEELGGVWKLSQLQGLGLKKEQVALLQLSFQVLYDPARKEFIDVGWWADLDTGEIAVTRNYRPLKAMKYIKEEDSVFEVAQIPLLTYYPGEINRRVRWEGAAYAPVTEAQLALLRSHACESIPAVIKKVKNQIKNPLSEKKAVLLFAFEQIGRIGADYVMQDVNGNTILLEDMPGAEETVLRLPMLNDADFLQRQVLLGACFYNEEKRRICLQPYSIVTQRQVVRLLY